MLILLDGNSLSIPDITGKFFALNGTIPQLGTPLEEREIFNAIVGPGQLLYPGPFAGYSDPSVISGSDLSNAAHRIQYIPIPQTAEPDQDTRPPAPTFLRAGPGNGGNILTWINPISIAFDFIEIWASVDNNRTNATKVGETRSDFFTHRLPLGGLRYYWIRARINPVSGRRAVFSEWERVNASDGESSNIETPGEVPEAPDHFRAEGKVNGIQFNWSLPWAKLSGLIRLYEAAHGDPIEDATARWEGYDLGVLITRDTDEERDYWIVLAKGGAESVPSPNGAGLAVAPSSVTTDLTASPDPSSVSRSATLGTNPRFVIAPPMTCVATGGTPPYTFLWTWFSGGAGIDLGSITFPDTACSASGNLDGTTLSGVARCTATDAVAATAFCDVNVQIHFPSIA
jgi:hypothetical protein